MPSEDNDPDWKGTGKKREEVRLSWEALPKESRPSWAKYVSQQRDHHERSQKKQEFETALAGYVGAKITVPSDLSTPWLEASPTFPPLKQLDSTRPNHKEFIYRLTPDEKLTLSKLWEEWKAAQTAVHS